MDVFSPTTEKDWRDSSLSKTMHCGNGYQRNDSSLDVSITSPYSTHSNCDQIYYGIYLAPDSEAAGKLKETVFTDKGEALRTVKQNKNARFRAFYSEIEALEFSKSGGEVIAIGSPSSSGESSLYKGPKSQELVKFRKAIENNDINLVKKLLDENPRYLIGSGDTPTILQEGCRYNALHIAARARDDVSEICSYILSVISNTSFLGRLYGQNNSSLQVRKNMLVDLYLNTPDKGSNETPLHFASKLGAVEIVKILTSYSQCDKLRRNKSGLTPADIACSRAPENMVHNKGAILKLLDTQYFIPVLRSADNSLPPVIGEPFTNSNPPIIQASLLEGGISRITPALEVQAVAGPMTKDQAQVFRKKWKTPPRITNSPILKQRPALCDPEKGLEKIGRLLANEFGVQWKEYWPFLKSFQDLSSEEGLNSLENYLKERFMLVFNDDYSSKHSGDNNEGLCYKLNNKPLPFICNSPLNSSFRGNITFSPSNGNDNQVIYDLTEEFSKLRIASPNNSFIEEKKSDAFPLLQSGCEIPLLDTSPVKKAGKKNFIRRTLFFNESDEEKIENNSGDDNSHENSNTNIFDGNKNDKERTTSIQKTAEEENPDENINPNIFDGNENDAILSDDEFFTPPNSPDFKITFPLSSYEEDCMLPAECGPEVYLTGSEPSKIDKAVLDALEQVSLSMETYPHIVMWKLACQQRAHK